MVEYFKLALSKYAQFTGRSRRSEYWYFTLANVLISLTISALGWITGADLLFGLLSILLSLALLIPALAVLVRRLHDTGHSGWWYFIVFTFIGVFLLLYWLALDSEEGTNMYGPNPKTGATEGDYMRHLVE